MIKTLVKILGIILILLLLCVAGGVTFLYVKFPKMEPPAQITAQATPQRIQRGDYLFHHVTLCVACHSVRNEELYSVPMIAGTDGQGELFMKQKGFGALYAPNITPYALGNWSDGEIARAITSGVSKDGRPLFPVMPYDRFALLSENDLLSIITYTRTLKPISHNVPASHFDFPLNLIVRTIPEPAHRQPAPDQKNYGEYLATIASCTFCHTPTDEHETALPGMKFAGGHKFEVNNHGIARSANITPDPETGIGKWTKEEFISRFQRFRSPDAAHIAVRKGEPNTVMPWTWFAGMTDEDLGAIYDYLRTVPAITNKVERFAKKS